MGLNHKDRPTIEEVRNVIQRYYNSGKTSGKDEVHNLIANVNIKM